MIEDFQDKQRQQGARVRSVMDYVMGIIFFLIGLYFLFYRQLGIKMILNREPSNIDYIIGGLFILYGSWRIYRGYKKNYYR
jgi:threonine/homoserine/homoserine lactone efflux protein